MLLITAGGIAWHSFEVLQAVGRPAPVEVGKPMKEAHSRRCPALPVFVRREGPLFLHGVKAEQQLTRDRELVSHVTNRARAPAGELARSGLHAPHESPERINVIHRMPRGGGSGPRRPRPDSADGTRRAALPSPWSTAPGRDGPSTLELVDAAVDPSLLEPIRETIVKVDGVKGCHRLRGRKAGTSLYLDVHIEVYPFLSVSAAHDIGETVRHHIQKTHNQVAEVFIHIDPSYSMGANVDKKRILGNLERRNSDVIPRQRSAEAIVSDIISSHFPKKMCLEHLMLHYLRGRVLLQVQVSMSPEILIRDAMDIAKKAEEEIMKVDASICQVSVQLRLGQRIEQLQLAASKSGANDLHAEKQ
ncbi:unnamed protein product [Triticum turgidum subsp. durum]|uniref:Cation efflux protein cytoplasmic domain-containing protein n=1 Tax=Triticum turgidum subsp. durum TaxID=4567 RepID=A0A9R0S8T3_TRITD|nr:unnamed protein product [Triticum turgidum subsp. durum]